ncbi:MAG: hypothetical protein ACXVHB_23910 [Solirubrobacteraceae bacterium]
MATQQEQSPPSTRQTPEPSALDTDLARVAWYAGLGALVAFEVIEWPIAALLAASHFIEHNARHAIVKQLTEGLEEGV